MSNYLSYIGWKKEIAKKNVEEVFTPASTIQVADRYLDYLKELDHYQKERRTTIENKNSQLVGQASIVTSIFSLFIPLLMDKFNGLSLYITIPFCVVFLIVLAHYLLTIFHSINTLKINKYKYATRKTSTITKSDRANTELEFLNEEIDDLVFTINQATPTDNRKGDNLIFATRCFEIANVGFGILALAITISIFFLEKETPQINVSNLKEIKLTVPDTMNNRIINFQKIDSITVKIDSTRKGMKGIAIPSEKKK